MSKIYYKVVSSDLKSVVAKNYYLSVQYKIGEWVRPNIAYTDLMVFENLRSAKIFMDEYQDQRLFECYIKNPRKTGIFCHWLHVRYGITTPLQIEKMISIKKKKKKYTNLIKDKIPKGTIFCSSIKLLKEIGSTKI